MLSFWKILKRSFFKVFALKEKKDLFKGNRFVLLAKRLLKWTLKTENDRFEKISKTIVLRISETIVLKKYLKRSFWKKYSKRCLSPAIVRRPEHTCLKLKHINFTHFKIFGTSPEATCFMLFSAITNVISVFYFQIYLELVVGQLS